MMTMMMMMTMTLKERYQFSITVKVKSSSKFLTSVKSVERFWVRFYAHLIDLMCYEHATRKHKRSIDGTSYNGYTVTTLLKFNLNDGITTPLITNFALHSSALINFIESNLLHLSKNFAHFWMFEEFTFRCWRRIVIWTRVSQDGLKRICVRGRYTIPYCCFRTLMYVWLSMYKGSNNLLACNRRPSNQVRVMLSTATKCEIFTRYQLQLTFSWKRSRSSKNWEGVTLHIPFVYATWQNAPTVGYEELPATHGEKGGSLTKTIFWNVHFFSVELRNSLTLSFWKTCWRYTFKIRWYSFISTVVFFGEILFFLPGLSSASLASLSFSLAFSSGFLFFFCTYTRFL